MTQHTHLWQWKLDSNLPGRLGQIGDWLNRGEEMVEDELSYGDKPEDNADLVHARLEECKVSQSHTKTKSIIPVHLHVTLL